MIGNKLKIALVKPPLIGHAFRGSGNYFRNLSFFLKKDPRLDIEEIDLSYTLNQFDLIHYPYFDPFFLTMPLLGKYGKKPYVVTVHDLIPLKYPEEF